jgi:hypothetical protein
MIHMSHEGTMSGHSLRCDQGDDLNLPHHSARLPRDTSTSIRGWHMHYLDVHQLGGGGGLPSKKHTTLLSLRDPINPICAST